MILGLLVSAEMFAAVSTGPGAQATPCRIVDGRPYLDSAAAGGVGAEAGGTGGAAAGCLYRLYQLLPAADGVSLVLTLPGGTGTVYSLSTGLTPLSQPGVAGDGGGVVARRYVVPCVTTPDNAYVGDPGALGNGKRETDCHVALIRPLGPATEVLVQAPDGPTGAYALSAFHPQIPVGDAELIGAPPLREPDTINPPL